MPQLLDPTVSLLIIKDHNITCKIFRTHNLINKLNINWSALMTTLCYVLLSLLSK